MTATPDSNAARYRILRPIGRGAMADVHLAVDLTLNRKVALKLLATGLRSDPAAIRRFRQEALAMASLSSPATVTVFDTGDFDGVPFIAMELADGTLQDRLDAAGRFPAPTAAAHVRRILDGLGRLHAAGIIHRDLKPQNVLVFPGGELKLTDLGVARSALSEFTDVAPGTIVGTGAYLSPEQARGEVACSHSDLYAAGVLLFALLTGSVPFPESDGLAAVRRHATDDVPHLSSILPGIDEGLAAVVARALAKAPSERYHSAAEFAAALEPFAQDVASFTPASPMAVERSSTPTLVVAPRARRRPRRTPLVAAAAAAALTFALGNLSLVGSVATVDGAEAAPPAVSVPALVDLHLEAAAYAVDGEPYRVRLVRRASTLAADGYVIAQRPAAGSLVEPGSLLTLVVSSGPPQAVVPPLVGLGRDEAARLLETLELRPTFVKVISAKPKGSIVSQSVPAGKRLTFGSPVRVNVSDGPHLAEVPALVGTPVAAARAALELRKLAISTRAVPSAAPAGTVVAQAPGGGRLREGSTVRVNVSSGVPMRAVPDLVGLDDETARGALRTARLGRRIVTQAVSHAGDDGVVLTQSPAAGDSVLEGAVVTIVVGRFMPAAPGEAAE